LITIGELELNAKKMIAQQNSFYQKKDIFKAQELNVQLVDGHF
jgi:hypothetical protein